MVLDLEIIEDANTPITQLMHLWQRAAFYSISAQIDGPRITGGPSGWLDGLSDADIQLALEITWNRQRRRYITRKRPELLFPSYEAWQKAKHLAACRFDRTMAALSWSGIDMDDVSARLR